MFEQVVTQTVRQTDAFFGPEVGWFALSPMLALLGGALAMMLVGALTPTWPKGMYALASATTAGTAGALAMVQWDDITDNGPATLVGGAVAFDTLSMFLTITICLAVVLVSLLSDEFLRGTPNDGPEIYALFLVAAVGGIVMASANDLIVLFLGLETLSLALYVLAASNRRSLASAESGIKYFVLGGFASAFFLYGVALLYGSAGSTNISEIVATFQTGVDIDNPDALALAGLALLIVGLGFKVAAVPFHVWTPDVYQGAPSPVTAFMASAGKAAAFAAMLRVLVIALPFFRDDWRPVIWVLAVASLVVGSVLAIVQTDVKRMLAYSSVSHAGFLLVGVEAAGHRAGEADPGSGMPSVVLYLMLYSVLVIGSFAVVTVVSRGSGAGDGDSSLESFKGLSQRRPLLALAFTVFLLAQAGVPLTSGFVAKFGVIQAAVEERSYAIAIIAMVAAVVAAFLYLRIMVNMWLAEPADGVDEATAAGEPGGLRVPLSAGVAIAGAAAFTLFVGVLPGWLIDAADTVTAYAR
ncbi:MAG: NADH-quinone oxidoreductase subunit N [Ilumatobacter sp.]|nr:NADH-quinone oxidoreductase subunit N [Ilumatobacter sp.]